MKKSTILFILSFLFTGGVFGQSLTIPTTHPRLWFNQARLNQAKTWYASHPFTPGTNVDIWHQDNARDWAFHYLLTGNASDARKAISWSMLALKEMMDNLYQWAGNEQRWFGEDVILIYDWCYSQHTQKELDSVKHVLDTCLTKYNKEVWGGPDMQESNFYWGYFRNNLLWGIASYYHNTNAQTFLDNALITRWKNSFLPYSQTKVPGGNPPEGVAYGAYMLRYPTVGMETADYMGRNMYNETNFYLAGAYTMIYQTLPELSYNLPSSNTKSWLIFPYGDSESLLRNSVDEPMINNSYGEFMKNAAMRYKGTATEGYVRKWLELVKPEISLFVDAVDAGGTSTDLSNLPLDYYTPGFVGQAYLKTKWGAGATAVNLQMVSPILKGHEHLDVGNWQIWRSGRWLIREAAGRGTGSGYDVPAFDTTQNEDVQFPIAHNSLFFGDRGQAYNYYADAKLLRMESNPDYYYAASDMTPTYVLAPEDQDRYGNPNAEHVEREFIFIRKLETLVIFDRMKSSTKTNSKTFVAHFLNRPVRTAANTYLGTNGDQAVRVTTLYPTNASFNIINEVRPNNGRTDNLNRLQINSNQNRTDYFLHVVQARDANGTDLTINSTEDANSFTITLSHPTKGFAKVVLMKGINSNGGQIAYSPTALPSSLNNLRTDVQKITVTTAGPSWDAVQTDVNSLIQNTNDNGNLGVYPNPVKGQANISFNAPNNGVAKIEIIDLQGRIVEKLKPTTSSGNVSWNAGNLTPGIYFVRLNVNNSITTRKVCVVK